MKKYVLVGTGYRGLTAYAKPMVEEFKDDAILCGFYDINHLRANYASEQCGGVPVFDDFETMIKETKPDYVIVATIDSVHHEYVIKAMEMGCDVILEKPISIDIERCSAIMEAEKRTGRKITVVFNMRFRPGFTKVRELIAQGTIGEVLNVNLEWMLDTVHGANYFRRWHRNKENSAGLLLQKSTHHFDMVNWCLNDTPKTVSAFATKRFYGLDKEKIGIRCLTCSDKKDCKLYFDIEAEKLQKELYKDTESGDGYIRDLCPFGADANIHDTMAVNVQYESGTTLAYNLVAYAPYEGWKMTVTGTNGRIETENVLRGRLLFRGDIEDTNGLTATSMDGVKSALVGACANVSIEEGRVVNIKEILERY